LTKKGEKMSVISAQPDYYSLASSAAPPPPKKRRIEINPEDGAPQAQPVGLYRTHRCHNHTEFLKQFGLTKEAFLKIRQSWPPPHNINASQLPHYERNEEE
jgi:hypothetical protein